MSGVGKGSLLGNASLALVLMAAIAPGAGAQSALTAAGGAVHYEFYRFTSPVAGTAKSVSLLTSPFAARAAIAGLTVDVSGAMAHAEVNLEGGSSASLSGLTDTGVRLTKRLELVGTALEMSAIGLIPTGHARLGFDETIAAGMVASDILPFRISNWGTGGGAIFDVSAVRAVAGGSVGVAASYRLQRDFRPFTAVDVHYRPGNEVGVRFAVDRAFDNAHMAAFQLGYSRFGEDEWNGIGLLRSGGRLLALGSYAVPAGSGYASAYVGVLHRSGGALGGALWLRLLLSGIEAPPSETLVVLGSAARMPWDQRLLLPSFEVRVLRHGDGTGSEVLLGIGGSAEIPIGDGNVRVVPTTRLHLGQVLMAGDAESPVRGLELGLGVRFGGGP